MTRNVPAHDLNEDRIRDLRRVRDRIDRDEAKAPWQLQPARRDWLQNHGLIAVAKVTARSTPEERRNAITVTPLGLRVLELWGKRVRTPHADGTVVGVQFAPNGSTDVIVETKTAWQSRWRVPIEFVVVDEQQEGARV